MGTMKVAVIGSSAAGLTAAHTLARAGVEVVLYESQHQIGDHHAHAEVKKDGINDLDVGEFMTLRQGSYSNLITHFEKVGVEVVASDVSFGISLAEGKKVQEWSSNGLAGLFAQKRNFIDPSFWSMIREIVKFSSDIPKFLRSLEEDGATINLNETLGEFLASNGYSQKFRDNFMIPICASIFCCGSESVLDLSTFSILTFFHDSQFFQLFGRSQWLTIKGSPESYVKKVSESLKNAGAKMMMNTSVTQIKALDGGSVQLVDDKGGVDVFDKCVIATHAPEALLMRRDEATPSERRILSAFQYADRHVYLHRDQAFMPTSSAAWGAWNFVSDNSERVYLTQWLNLIQNLGHTGLPLLLTMNPPKVPEHVERYWRKSEIVPTLEATNASKQLESIQGQRGLWYCGSYQAVGCGLPGDEIVSGFATAKRILEQNFEVVQLASHIVPSWSEFGARQTLMFTLSKFITVGNLRLVDAGGQIFDFAGKEKGCSLTSILRIENPAFYWKIATKNDLGLADAFIDGDFSFPGDKKRSLCNFLELIIANMEATDAKARMENKKAISSRGWGWTKPLVLTATIGTAVSYFRHLLRDNTMANSQQNISDGYDQSNEMYSFFLDETMSYSCGIFEGPNDTLKDAQMRKIHLLMEKARINSTHEVLEIGCGWAGLALEIVRLTGCRYTGVTLSIEQLKFATARVKEAGLEDRITFLLCDYRAIPGYHKFHRIISCEMIEHLGHNYQRTFFEKCDRLLAKDGLIVLQASSTPDERYEYQRKSHGFIKERIFPGIDLICPTVLLTAAAPTFSVEHFDNIGRHYYSTLMSWQENFLGNASEIRGLGFDDKFIRKMVYYFSLSAATFRTLYVGCLQVVLSRPNNVAALGDTSVCFPPDLSSEKAWKMY